MSTERPSWLQRLRGGTWVLVFDEGDPIDGVGFGWHWVRPKTARQWYTRTYETWEAKQ